MLVLGGVQFCDSVLLLDGAEGDGVPDVAEDVGDAAYVVKDVCIERGGEVRDLVVRRGSGFSTVECAEWREACSLVHRGVV